MSRSYVITYQFDTEDVDLEGAEEFAEDCSKEFHEHIIQYGESVRLLSVVEIHKEETHGSGT